MKGERETKTQNIHPSRQECVMGCDVMFSFFLIKHEKNDDEKMVGMKGSSNLMTVDLVARRKTLREP